MRATAGGQSPVVPEPLRYDDALRESIRANLDRHERRVVVPGETQRHAAVVVAIVDSAVGEDRTETVLPDERDRPDLPGPPEDLDGRMVDVAGGAAFLLCRRAARLSRHAGQWALPGGRLDPGEGVIAAALRELEEEVGLALDDSSVLGLLDDYPTRSGFVITPVVTWVGGRGHLVPDPGEVRAVYRVGLHQLLRSDSPRLVTIPESPRPVVQIPLSGDLVHAPTGAVLLQMRWLGLEGRGDPVDELEQPVFAWG